MTMNQEIFDLQVLAAALRVDGAITEFSQTLRPSDVGLIHGHTGIHEFYKALVSFHKQTKLDPINPIAFKAWLETETDIYDALGGDIGVKELFKILEEIEISDTKSIIRIVEYKAKQRRQLDILQDLKELLIKTDEVDSTKIDLLTQEIKTLSQDIDYDPLSSIRTSIDIAQDAELLWDIPPFLPTQFKELNKALGYSDDGGAFRGGVMAIMAMSGEGKSTLAKCLCNNWLDEGYSVLFINYEEAQAHWERILMTQIIGENVYARANNATSTELSKWTEMFKNKMAEWGDRLMVRHDPETLFFEDLERWLRDIIGHSSRKPDVVVIDTIQSMFTKTGGKARWGEFEQIMVGLEKLAKDMNAVFIITSQQNSNALKEKRETFTQADAGGSLTIVQKSTVSLFLKKLKDTSGDDSISEDITELQIVKNRITGTAFAGSPPKILYRDDIKSFVPLEKSEIPKYNDTEIELEDLGVY